MALYVEVPKDFDEIKQRIALGLTKRQMICFGIAGVIGGLTFWATVGKLGITGSCYCTFVAAAPAALFGIYHRNGMYLEQKLRLILRFGRNNNKKTYQSENVYEKIENAIEYRRLKKIVREYERRAK